MEADQGVETTTVQGAGPTDQELKIQFEKYSQFGDREKAGINITSISKWVSQSGMENIDAGDISSAFFAIAGKTSHLTYDQFIDFLKVLCKLKKLDLETVKAQLIECGRPSTSGTTTVITTGAVGKVIEKLSPSKPGP